MIFRKRTKHKLPSFPPGIAQTFESLCEALPATQVDDMKAEVSEGLEKLRTRSKSNNRIDLATAEKLAQICNAMLESYENFNEDDRKLVVGAIRYFAIIDDPLPDTTFASGMEDDVRVMNHVLERLGMEDHIVDLG
jgi:hypothetical protein